MQKTSAPFLFIICLFSLAAFSAENEGAVVARVNGTAITERDLTEKVNATINRTYFHRRISPEKKKEIRQQSLQTLIEEELMYRDALKRKITVANDIIDRQYEKVVQRFPSKQEFKKALKRAGYTSKEYKGKIERDLLIKEVYKRHIVDKNILSEQDIKEYYADNTHKFIKPETVNLQHILIKVKDPTSPGAWQHAAEKAQELLEKLQAGADFAELAGKYSEGRYRIKGGRLGEVHRGRLPKEVEDYAFKMAVGTISTPIKTEHGWSIIKLLEKKEQRQLDFDEVKDKLKKELQKKRITEAKAEWLAALKSRAKIDIHIDFNES